MSETETLIRVSIKFPYDNEARIYVLNRELTDKIEAGEDCEIIFNAPSRGEKFIASTKKKTNQRK